jgi:hypothetical protein
VEITFKDNEILEGVIENSISHLTSEGFLLRPTDAKILQPPAVDFGEPHFQQHLLLSSGKCYLEVAM